MIARWQNTEKVSWWWMNLITFEDQTFDETDVKHKVEKPAMKQCFYQLSLHYCKTMPFNKCHLTFGKKEKLMHYEVVVKDLHDQAKSLMLVEHCLLDHQFPRSAFFL